MLVKRKNRRQALSIVLVVLVAFSIALGYLTYIVSSRCLSTDTSTPENSTAIAVATARKLAKEGGGGEEEEEEEETEEDTGQKKTPAIPKILHQIWVSRDGKGKPLPAMCQKYSTEFREAHEALGWEYHLWRDELWEKFKEDAIITGYFKANFEDHTVAFIADRFRLLLLRDHGGVFVDVDAKMVKPFSGLLDKLPPTTEFFAGKLISSN
jgi:mannosyltransferase OCH1-like enzyme